MAAKTWGNTASNSFMFLIVIGGRALVVAKEVSYYITHYTVSSENAADKYHIFYYLWKRIVWEMYDYLL